MTGLGYKTPSSVFMHLEALQHKQYIVKKPYSHRNLVIVKDVMCA